jgi:hypothetical protein
MRIHNFTQFNTEFWRDFTSTNCEDLLLVETNSNPVINHSNAIAGKMISTALKIKIGWLIPKLFNKELLKSYDINSTFIFFEDDTYTKKFWYLLLSIYNYLYYIFPSKNLLKFKYKNITYGDFVYDNYLSMFSKATLHKWDYRLILTFFQLHIRDSRARKILANKNIKALLVSHYMGFNTGILTRVALSKGIPVYWKGGGHEYILLNKFEHLKEVYNYPKRPTTRQLELLSKDRMHIKKAINKYVNNSDKPFYGAFASVEKLYKQSHLTRESFLKKYKLKEKPTIFVMLHAFNDHPHSHFKSMLFKDYFDWFNQTLSYAKQDTGKNWIIKEHPVNRAYKTTDVKLHSFLGQLPNHIVFLDSETNVTGSIALDLADLVVTCLGSAGLEFAAFKGSPSLIAGDSAYNKFGFTYDPKNVKDYFKTLEFFQPRPLSEKQRVRAQACYLYYSKYCMVQFSAGPQVTFDEARDLKLLEQVYYERVLNEYKKNGTKIYDQFHKYSNLISQPKFYRLESLPDKYRI